MPAIMNERKDRRIVFRVSEEEYLRLQRLCVATKNRSISDLVRSAVDYWANHGAGELDAKLHGGLQELNARMAALAALIERLVEARVESH
jgi:hypothetical protein